MERDFLKELEYIALNHEGVCLSTKYINATTKLKWRCKYGHMWFADGNHIKQGTWCPICGREKTRISRKTINLEMFQKIAKERGGKCLSLKYESYENRLLWQCKLGHRWESTPYSVRQLKTWCPVCAGNIKKNISDLNKTASERGGRCLSTEYINVDTKYDWECSLGHKFRNSFNKVSHGQWCPTCSKSGTSEEICRETFKQIFKDDFAKHRPLWLKNDRGFQMEIDGYSEKLKVGFEYHGIQHFKKTGIYIKTDDLLKQRINDDKLKEFLCKKNNVSLFILTYLIPYWEFPKEMERQYKIFKLNISNIDFNRKININDAYIRKDRIIELRELLKSRDIELLSIKWLGTKEKYRARCLIDGHTWDAIGSEFIAGAGCKKCAMKINHDKQRSSISDLQKYADKYGGKILSLKYTNQSAKYIFLCKNNHKFIGIPSNMKFRNQWCPVCEKRQIRKNKNR